MTPKRFYPSEEVVCIDKEMKPVRDASHNAPDLVWNNFYTIVHYEEFKYGHWWLRVSGTPFGSFYTEDTFAPILRTEEVLEELNEFIKERQLKRIHGELY